MRVAVFLGHPAHFYIYKNVITNLHNSGYDVSFVIKQKDVLKQLLDGANLKYSIIRKKERKSSSKLGLLFSVLKLEINMLLYLIKNKPHLIIGTYLSFSGKITRTPTLIINEDDAAIVPNFAKMSYPLAKEILTPNSCDNGKWNNKSIKYQSYHELAYLHPNHFKADKDIVEKYFSTKKPYVIIRFAKLNAHHDKGIQGINTEIAQKLIDILKPYADIYITSERELEFQFEQYRIKINPLDIHHVMAFAQLYIGDSQTMAAEAGVLGVPFVRFNDFVGRIGYLKELEDVYKLGYGIKTSEVDKLYKTVSDLISMPDRSKVFALRRQKMLSEKIDYAQFLTWFIENYPQSAQIMRENPDYQYRFK